jgi:hypothetical protein
MMSNEITLKLVDCAFVVVCIVLFVAFRNLGEGEEDLQQAKGKRLQHTASAPLSSSIQFGNTSAGLSHRQKNKCQICLEHIEQNQQQQQKKNDTCRCQSCHESYHKDCLHFYICSESLIKPVTKCPCCRETIFKNSTAAKNRMILPAAISEYIECVSSR